MSLHTDALRYHAEGRPGKIEIALTKPCMTQRDLSLAYSPGVAYPCLDIAANPDRVFDYTAKGNLVAVISNGTAVLGLGDIGPAAGKPVMEGKGVLFKRFADIDVFDLEIDERDPDKLIDTIARLEPTFGGINLEDIKAPECFYIETELKRRMNIPVFHDDQHGTAIISAAGLLNAAELACKPLESLKVVVSGAGASAIACMNLWQLLGVRNDRITMCDSKGVLHLGRQDSVDVSKLPFVRDTTARTLADALVGADVFIGLSKANTVTPAMLATMADRPIVFALANPDPEIPYPAARQARPDAIIGTGRSDFPNQVNNVLGFPYIFRGALDVGSRQINDQMKLAAVRSLAALAREDVPDRVRQAYGGAQLKFGPDYILPKPVDERVLLWVAPAVAQAAIDSGVARKHLDPRSYRDELERRLGPARSLMRHVMARVARDPKRVLFADADDDRVLRAVRVLVDERLVRPVLVGDEGELRARAAALDLDLEGVEFVGLRARPTMERELAALLAARGRRGMSAPKARMVLQSDALLATLVMLREHMADGAVVGLQHTYPDTIRAALQILGPANGSRSACGVHVVPGKRGPLFLADTSVNPDPDAAMLAEIAIAAADLAHKLGVQPHVALVSFANFGASRHPEAVRAANAVAMARRARPDLDIDGEMQVQIALDPEARARNWPHATLQGGGKRAGVPVAWRRQRQLSAARAVRRRRCDRSCVAGAGAAVDGGAAGRVGRDDRADDRAAGVAGVRVAPSGFGRARVGGRNACWGRIAAPQDLAYTTAACALAAASSPRRRRNRPNRRASRQIRRRGTTRYTAMATTFTTIPEAFLARSQSSAAKLAFKHPTESGWAELTWGQTGDKVKAIACGLRALGVQPQQRVAIVAGTRIEWVLCDLGILCAGGATTTVYPASTPDEVQYILQDSESVVIFAEDDKQVEKLAQVRGQLPALHHVVTLDGKAGHDGWVMTLADLQAKGRDWAAANPGAYEAGVAACKAEELATLIYTSGTTGRPKGVELTHACWVYEGQALDNMGLLKEGDLQYLWLPLAHSFGKVLEAAQIIIGFPTAIDGRIDKLVENLAVIQPTFIAAVPRIFEKVYNKVIAGAKGGSPLKYKIFQWAVGVGKQVSALRQNGQDAGGLLALKFKIADKLVFSKLKARFGGRVRFFVSGSAPLSRDIAEFFHAADILILEGYGLTESSAASFVNRPDKYKFGTVGMPVPGTRLKILPDTGEILIAGPGIMQGYKGLAEQTAETIWVDEEGTRWLKTGDKGELDGEFLKITDRIKELIKTSGGKYVAPAHIESKIKVALPISASVLVHGNNRNFCSALVGFPEEELGPWAQTQGISGKSYSEILVCPELNATVQAAIDGVNADLPSYSTVKKFAILPKDLSVDGGELTQSLKVKRKVVEGKYQDVLEGFYTGSTESM